MDNNNNKAIDGVFGKVLIIGILLYTFFSYDNIISVERIQETRAKNKLLTVLLHWLSQNEVGYYIGRGLFLIIPLYLIWTIIDNIRKH
jgi:hypothetical protein